MKSNKPEFSEIIALARRGTVDETIEVSPGLACRVAARWSKGPHKLNWFALIERVAPLGASAAVVLCLLTAWYCREDFGAITRAADSFADFAGLVETSADTP